MWAWWGKQFHEPKCGSGHVCQHAAFFCTYLLNFSLFVLLVFMRYIHILIWTQQHLERNSVLFYRIDKIDKLSIVFHAFSRCMLTSLSEDNIVGEGYGRKKQTLIWNCKTQECEVWHFKAFFVYLLWLMRELCESPTRLPKIQTHLPIIFSALCLDSMLQSHSLTDRFGVPLLADKRPSPSLRVSHVFAGTTLYTVSMPK